jgi:Uma2 family endonuclease
MMPRAPDERGSWIGSLDHALQVSVRTSDLSFAVALEPGTLAIGYPMRTPRIEEDRTLVTGDELGKMPNLGRSELVRGRIVLSSPAYGDHGRIEGNFFHELRSFAEPRGLGKVLVGEVGVYTGRDPDTVRGADVAFLSSERYAQAKRACGFLDVAPDLVVEVISSSESRASLKEKLGEYFACGVRLVWVALSATATVRVYRSFEDVREYGPGDALPGDDVLPGFSVPVSRLFED